MDINRFWSIVEVGKDAEEPTEPVRAELEKLAAEEIEAFQRIFDDLFARAYRWDLWGAAYLMEGGCSDDGFMDFRYALISQGREVYEKALANADSLAESDVVSDEDFGYVALGVYEEKAGKEMPARGDAQPAEPSGEAWDFDDATENARRLPRVWKEFGW